MNYQLSPILENKWHDKGFKEPTDIQLQVFDKIMTGQSLIAISPTGSGKTLAYLLPVLIQLEKNQTLQLVIFAPTQELAKQISEVIKEWAFELGLKSQLILGSANLKRQLDALKGKPEIIIATPGRFVEILEQSKKIKLHQLKTIVFDEADYLLEDEQRTSIEQILRRVMKDTQQLWVSATLGPSLKQMNNNLDQPLEVIENSKLPETIEHLALMTNNRQKVLTLKRLAQVDRMRAIVFFDQVNEIEMTAAKLIYEEVPVAVLHGQLSKMERELAIKRIKTGEVKFLLATDVSARGLDIENLPFVIHYNKAATIQTYLHRSGRTGRMGKHGTVISLVNEQELRDLSEMLDEKAIVLEERFIYQGQLVNKDEKESLKTENIIFEKTNIKSKKKDKVPTNSNPKPIQKQKLKKKKNRHRDQKNKGKRKAKGEKER